jgi:hypothetical protein
MSPEGDVYLPFGYSESIPIQVSYVTYYANGRTRGELETFYLPRRG